MCSTRATSPKEEKTVKNSQMKFAMRKAQGEKKSNKLKVEKTHHSVLHTKLEV